MDTFSLFSELVNVKNIVNIMVQYWKAQSPETLSYFVAPNHFEHRESKLVFVSSLH